MTVSRKHQSRIWRSRLFGVFFFCFVAVFLVGLPVGRTPDYVGKQIEADEAPTGPQWTPRRKACLSKSTGYWLNLTQWDETLNVL